MVVFSTEPHRARSPTPNKPVSGVNYHVTTAQRLRVIQCALLACVSISYSWPVDVGQIFMRPRRGFT